MKKFIFFTFCMVILNTSYAQWSNKWLIHNDHQHLLYTSGGVSLGSNSGGNLGLNFVYDSKYSVEVGFSSSSGKVIPESSPMLKSTDNAETDMISSPNEMMENYHVMFGRHFYLNSKGTIRLVVQGGPGMSVVNSKTPVLKSSGYTVTPTVKTSDFSVMMNSKIEFPINKVLGFTAGPVLLVNHDKTYFTMGAGFIYGIVSKY